MYIDLGAAKGVISIHAPLTGSDFANCKSFLRYCAFQSTLPLRGATIASSRLTVYRLISIHAPLTGSD